MNNYYTILVSTKNPSRYFRRLLKNNIEVFDIKYFDDKIEFKISYLDYLRLLKIKTIDKMEIVRISGSVRYKKIGKYYHFFIYCFIFFFILTFIYSKMIFFINIKTDDINVKKIISEELKKNDITIYSFAKNYKTLNNISEKIKRNNSSLIEWIEISHDGVSYNVSLVLKVRKDEKKITSNHNIIASKNGIIKDMYVTSGEVIKNKGDYVSKGDIIVSGLIYKNEDVKNIVDAKARVYAETWYKVKLKMNLKTKEKVKDKRVVKLVFRILNKDITIFKIEKDDLKLKNNISLINSSFFNIKIINEYQSHYVEKNYTKNDAVLLLTKKAESEILKKLNDDEKILGQKTLKITSENGKISVEVFFKLYENIAKKVEIELSNNVN